MYQCGDENVARYESFQKVKSKGDKIGHGYDLSRVWRTRQKWDWSGSREIDDHHLGIRLKGKKKIRKSGKQCSSKLFPWIA